MELSVIAGVIIPFIGTSLGAAFVFFMRKDLSRTRNRLLDKRHEICYHMEGYSMIKEVTQNEEAVVFIGFVLSGKRKKLL